MEQKYFLTASARYCHFLPDRIILTDHHIITKVPEMNTTRDKNIFIASVIGVLISWFLLYGVWVLGSVVFFALLSVVDIYFIVLLFRQRNYSHTDCIPKSTIRSIRLITPKVGNDYVLIDFEPRPGRVLTRRISIYDTKEATLAARDLFASEFKYDKN